MISASMCRMSVARRPLASRILKQSAGCRTMAEWCADNLRGVEAWKAEGLLFSTTSDEATKLYDGLLRQLVSWTDCAQLGGLGATAEKMIAADPSAVLTRAFKYGLELMGTGTSARINTCLENKILQVEKDAKEKGTEWEKAHVKAVKQWAYGNFRAAANTWEEILVEHPTDLLALKMAHEAYFFMGDCKNKRDSVKRVLPLWKKEMPCYSYLHGMYAFGLEECGEYREAEKEALTALSLNRFDCWATHARAHVLEMEGRYDDGIEFLQKTHDDWLPGWIIATHNYWHNAVFHIEKADYETALSIFDLEVSVRAAKRCAVLDMVDASSLLMRLEMEGVNVGNRWKELPSMASHWQDHVTAFNDVHLAPLFVQRGDVELESKMHDSLVNFTKSGYNDNSKVCEIVGLNLYEGMVDYLNEKYDSAAEKMLPVRNEVYRIGGSHAQRDVFTQALVHACTMSEKEENWRMTPIVLKERASIRSGHSPLAERLATQFHLRHPL